MNLEIHAHLSDICMHMLWLHKLCMWNNNMVMTILHLYCTCFMLILLSCEYVHMHISITDIHYNRLYNRDRHEQTEENRRTRRKTLEVWERSTTVQQLYSHKSQVWESTQGCTQMFTHPATDPVRLGLTWNSVVKGNTLTANATRAPVKTCSSDILIGLL